MMKALILSFLFLAGSAFAAPGLWSQPDRDGHGLQINNDGGFGHAVTWYLYREDGSSAVLVGGDTCEAFPCVLPLHEPEARWMGGALELGDPVGEIEIGVLTEGVLPVRFDLRAWNPERCTNISAGGVLFRECAGRLELTLLTQ